MGDWVRAWGPLLAVLAVTAVLRLSDLGGGPDPFDVDEGYTGVDALRVLAGHPTLYFAANNGAEPLYVYLAAVSTALLGPSAWALRLPAALAGVASVLATYLLVRAVFAEADLPPRLPLPLREGGRTRVLTVRSGIPWVSAFSRGERRRGEDAGDGAAPGAWGARDAAGVALLAALLQAVSLWHLHLSRDGSRVGLLPLLGAVAFLCLWRGLSGGGGKLGPHPLPPPEGARPCTRWWFVGAGGCFGLALYTYLPARLLPLVALALLAHLAFSRPWWLRAGWPGLMVLAGTAALVAAPLAVYYGAHWSAFWFRADMVSLVNPWVNGGDPWGLLGRNLLGTLGMFAGQGDADPQYNVAGLPVFPPALVAAFVAGLGLAVWRARRPEYALWLLWLGIMLLPGVLSASSPHFARQAGILPAVYMFPALALWTLWRWVAQRQVAGRLGRPAAGGAWRDEVSVDGRAGERRALRGEWGRWAGPGLSAAVIVAVVGSATVGTVAAYFGRPAAPGPSLLARLGTLPPNEEVYVAGSEETAEIGSYLSALGPGPRFTQGFHSLLLPRDAAHTTYLVEREWWWQTAEQLLWARYDLEPQPAPPGLEPFRVLRLRERPLGVGALPSAPWLPLPEAGWAVGARLVGYGLPAAARPGEVVGVTLRWRVETPAPDDPGQDYTLAVGLENGAGEEVAARDWLGHPTAAWRDGDEVASWFDLCLPATLPPGPLEATVALYSRADFARRPVLDASGAVVGDKLTFGRLPVEGPAQEPPCNARVHPALPPE